MQPGPADTDTEVSLVEEDPDLDALWSAGSLDRRLEPDRADERDSLAELARGHRHGLTSLLDRHGVAVWRFAAVITLDGHLATETSVTAWEQVVDDSRDLMTLGWPFRWEVLRRVQAIARDGGHGGASPDDLTPDRVPAPFEPSDDPAMVAVGFCRLASAHRGSLWLTEIERIPARDAGRLLGTSAIASAETLQKAAVEMLVATVEGQLDAATGRCASTVDRFLSYLEGTLIDTDVGVLHRHLRACDACSRRLDAIEDPFGVLLDRLAPPPADLTTATAERLRDHLHTARYG